MNLFKKTLIAAGAASIAVSPIAAAAGSVAPVATRAGPASAADSQLRGDGNNGRGLIFAALAIAAGVAVYLIAKDDNNNAVSP